MQEKAQLLCTLDTQRGELSQFSVDLGTGEITTGLENVCCDRALSMEVRKIEHDRDTFSADYETSLFGLVPQKWTENLFIDLNRPGDIKPFRLIPEGEDWSGLNGDTNGFCTNE